MVKQLFPTKGDSKFDKLYNVELIKDTIGCKGFPGLCILGNLIVGGHWCQCCKDSGINSAK